MIWIEREEVQVIHPFGVVSRSVSTPITSASIDEEVLHDDALLGIHHGHILSLEEAGRFCFCKVFHMPKVLVTVILLIDRYIYILGQEAERIMTAYKLRAPSQKGIHYKAWGPLVGQWLIRSMERAQVVYESMTLRGYRGEYDYGKKRKLSAKDILFFTVWLVAFVVIRRGF